MARRRGLWCCSATSSRVAVVRWCRCLVVRRDEGRGEERAKTREFGAVVPFWIEVKKKKKKRKITSIQRRL